MSDDLFGNGKIDNRNTPEDDNSNMQPLKNSNYSAYLCSGNIIFLDEYETLMEITLHSFDPELIIDSTSIRVSKLNMLGIDTDHLDKTLEETKDQFNNWKNSDSSLDKLQDIYDNLADGIRNYFSECYRLIDQEQKKYDIKLWQGSEDEFGEDYDFDEAERKDKFEKIEQQLQRLKITLDLLVPQNEIICHTNVGAVFSTINPESTSVSDMVKTIFQAIKKQENITVENINTIMDDVFLISEDKLTQFTKYSPNFLRSLTIYLDYIKGSFLSSLEQKSFSKDEFLAIVDKYNKSPVSPFKPDLSIRYGEDYAVISWEIPSVLADEVKSHKEKLIEMYGRVKNLLEKTGGSLEIDIIDDDKIEAKIGLPHQDAPELSESEKHDIIVNYSTLQGTIPFKPCYPKLKHSVCHKDGYSFKISLIDESSYDTEEKRTNLANLLNVLTEFNFGIPLTEFIPPRDEHACTLLFTRKNNTSSFHLNDKFILNDAFFKQLSKLTKLNICNQFSFLDETLHSAPDVLLESMIPILKKAKELCNGKLKVNVCPNKENENLPKIEILTTSGKLIGKVYLFEDEEGKTHIGGRLCSRTMTNLVVDTYGDIIDNQLDKDPDTNLIKFLRTDFYTELKNRGINPSSSFINFQNSILPQRYLNQISVLVYQFLIQNVLESGDVSIVSSEEGIKIDAPDPLEKDNLLDYVKRNPL